MAGKFSASWKCTGQVKGDATRFILSGDIPQSMAVEISRTFFRCYRDRMEETYAGRSTKPKPRQLTITINFPKP